jgi:predicted amidophosphoribosyltransferase
MNDQRKRKWKRGICRKCGKPTGNRRRRKCPECRRGDPYEQLAVLFSGNGLRQPLAPLLEEALCRTPEDADD